ncbi:MAG: SDR family oxidoreductase [Rhodospirillales bacterium]|nr:SDR family oxidoreductase [Rhodospirillales bacterium]
MNPTTSLNLKDQVALITGAARRIGRATALALAEEGAAIVLNARTSGDEIEAVAGEIRAMGGRAMTCLADITDEDAVQDMVDAVVKEFGRIDILINNAGIRRQAAFTEMSLSEWREILAVILDGTFLCSRAVIPVMIKGGGGAIVNIGGVTAHIGAMQRAHVSTGKAGLIGLTKALAVEFANEGITVNCIAPGKIGGKRSASSGESPLAGGVSIPVGREGKVEEVAAMIKAVCLPTGKFMTGQTIHVSGGLYMP